MWMLFSRLLMLMSVWFFFCSDDSVVFWFVVYCDSVVDVIDSCMVCVVLSGLLVGVVRFMLFEICWYSCESCVCWLFIWVMFIW